MANQVAAAALQYSKWLSKFICWIWAIYRFSVLIASAVVPEAAEALVSTMGTLDTIMIINEGTYLVNSLGEKWLYSERFVISAFNKGWFKTLVTSFKHIEKLKGLNNDNDDEEKEKETEEEEATDDGSDDSCG